jgi:SP family arabinose:H+ symporter-like MFS transporter
MDKPDRKYLIMVTFVAALGGLLFGFDIAIITGAVPFIRDHFQLNELQLGWGVSSLLVGCVIGSAFAGRLADRIGRKIILFNVALLFAVTSIATGLAPSFAIFVLARLCGGIAVGAASAVSPMYISETAPYRIRGRLVSFYQLSIVIGINISYFINYQLHDIGPNNWRWMFMSGAIPSIIFFLLLFFVPETPRYLFKSGQRDKAFDVLRRIGGRNNAEHEIRQISDSMKQSGKVKYRDLFRPGNLRPLWVGFGLAVFVQFCGINTIVDYAPIILESAGWEIDAALFATFVLGSVFLAFTFVSIWLIEKAGRRVLYLIGSAGLTAILSAITVLSLMGRFTGDIALWLIIGFSAFFAACIGPVFWTLVSEIFPNNIRGTAMSVPVFTQWIANAVVVGYFPWMLVNKGTAFTFGLLGICSMLMLLFTYRYVPETKGKTLEEIEALWQKTG